MLNRIFKMVSNGEMVKVIKFDDRSKQCIVELENGKTKAYSSTTLKDKRRFIPVEDEEKLTELKQEVIDSEKDLTDEEYAQIGKEIAEQAKEKAEAHKKHNMRKSLRLKEVTYKGETKSIREWAEETGIPWKTLYNRINNNGWPIDIALETPIGGRKPKEVR